MISARGMIDRAQLSDAVRSLSRPLQIAGIGAAAAPGSDRRLRRSGVGDRVGGRPWLVRSGPGGVRASRPITGLMYGSAFSVPALAASRLVQGPRRGRTAGSGRLRPAAPLMALAGAAVINQAPLIHKPRYPLQRAQSSLSGRPWPLARRRPARTAGAPQRRRAGRRGGRL